MEVEPVQTAREARKHLEEQERKARLMLCESKRSHKSLDLDAQEPSWRETLIIHTSLPKQATLRCPFLYLSPHKNVALVITDAHQGIVNVIVCKTIFG